MKIAQSFGYEVILQKGDERLSLQENTKGTKSHLSVTAVPKN
jgi:hypothetical protein